MAHTEHPLNSSSNTREVEVESELEDFEQDEVLRSLSLEDWFVTAEPGVPIWCY
jgi:hypothetical protein